MELIYLIGNYLLKFYYFYVMSIKGVVGFFLPDIAVPFVTGFFAILIEISFFIRGVYNKTFLEAFLSTGMWIFSTIWSVFLLLITEDLKIGFEGQQFMNLKAGFALAVLIVFATIQLASKISVVAAGVNKGLKD